MKEDYLKKAAYTLHFAKYFTMEENLDNVIMFLKMFQEITATPQEYVDKGIKCYDDGNIEKALEHYEKALELYPKSPEALYEIGLVYMTAELGIKAPKEGIMGIREKAGEKNSKLESHSGLAYFEKVRLYDPFFNYAYQGSKELTAQMAIILEEIDPLLPLLFKGTIDIKSMTKLGDAFVKINQIEYAVYAYTIAFYGSFKKKYNKKLLKKITTSLIAINARKTARFFEGEMKKIDNIK